jgi:protein TonB
VNQGFSAGIALPAAKRRRDGSIAPALALALSVAAHLALVWWLSAESAPQPVAGAVLEAEIAPLAGEIAASTAANSSSSAFGAEEAFARPPEPPADHADGGADILDPPAPVAAAPLPPQRAQTDAPRRTPAEGEGRRTRTARNAAHVAPGAGPSAETMQPGPASSPPRYGVGSAANPAPRYPEMARERGWEGLVVLAVNVAADGRAESVSVSRSSGHRVLDQAALEAVRAWRFEPARRGGLPIAGNALVPIRFRLED